MGRQCEKEGSRGIKTQNLFKNMNTKVIKLSEHVGNFAENKDVAKELRNKEIVPALVENQEIILDFEGIEAVTQSFIHALISELMRTYGSDVLDRIAFKNCNETIQKIIEIVVDYMQQRD